MPLVCQTPEQLLQVKHQLQTGDLLLFHGAGYWFSFLVEYFTWSEFSHVGMVLRDPVYIHPSLKGLYMIESGTESFEDAIDHKIKFGVQIVNLDKLIESYVGRIYVRTLKCDQSFRNQFDAHLFSVWEKIKDLGYDDYPWDLLRAEFKLNWGDNHRTNLFFCSALQTFLYQKMGLLKEDLPWDLVTPEDFNDFGKFQDCLVSGVELNNKFRIL